MGAGVETGGLGTASGWNESETGLAYKRNDFWSEVKSTARDWKMGTGFLRGAGLGGFCKRGCDLN